VWVGKAQKLIMVAFRIEGYYTVPKPERFTSVLWFAHTLVGRNNERAPRATSDPNMVRYDIAEYQDYRRRRSQRTTLVHTPVTNLQTVKSPR
jgi:hypothetical protein